MTILSHFVLVGWRRELVIRETFIGSEMSMKNVVKWSDIYYYSPHGTKLVSKSTAVSRLFVPFVTIFFTAESRFQ